ncbi:MAG: PIN domain-containing protein [Anaerolineae bacterium]|nr:PIN domain-containing protein [Anaerolineae bacterium]MDW8099798.1 PIN domain-containing protein [Anaerolineae bacterium]
MIFVVDASVHLNALNPAEASSTESQALLKWLFGEPWLVVSPTLLLIEVVTAVARVFDDPTRGLAVAEAVRGLPGQVWVSLDENLAREAARLAAEHQLRGADGVYAAVAHWYGAALITLDRQQLERLHPKLLVLTPAEALARLEQQALK